MSSPVEEQVYTAWFHTPVMRVAGPSPAPAKKHPGGNVATKRVTDGATAAPNVGLRTDSGYAGWLVFRGVRDE
jgi:hypothetical protein